MLLWLDALCTPGGLKMITPYCAQVIILSALPTLRPTFAHRRHRGALSVIPLGGWVLGQPPHFKKRLPMSFSGRKNYFFASSAMTIASVRPAPGPCQAIVPSRAMR